MMRPAAGDYHAGQHCRSDDSGDRTRPHRLMALPNLALIVSGGTRIIR